MSDLQAEVDALVQWAEHRGLDPTELMSVCSVVIGRTIAAYVRQGATAEQACALAAESQKAIMDGAGLNPGADPRH